MRDAFTRALQRLAAEDKNLLLVTGDLGFGVLKPFWETYPDQFINAGIAEQQNMVDGIGIIGVIESVVIAVKKLLFLIQNRVRMAAVHPGRMLCQRAGVTKAV